MKHKAVVVKPKLPKVSEQPEIKRMPPISAPGAHEPKPEPKQTYTQADWEKEVAEHVPPGRPIPDWLAAKAPTG
jgi:hypothetical protein